MPTKAGLAAALVARVRGSFRHRDEAGLNTFVFTGRVGGRRLGRGRYRLTAVAADRAGNRSKPVRRRFRIVGGSRG